MSDCDAVMNQYVRVGAKAIAAMQRCQVIARYGIGVDIVDVEAATARGILVTNVRDYCTEEVADPRGRVVSSAWSRRADAALAAVQEPNASPTSVRG